MVSKETIKNLADLVRLDIKEDELGGLASEIDSILGYVGEVKEISSNFEEGVDIGPNFNVFREDTNPNESGVYRDDILAEAPETLNGFIKVKKIL